MCAGRRRSGSEWRYAARNRRQRQTKWRGISSRLVWNGVTSGFGIGRIGSAYCRPGQLQGSAEVEAPLVLYVSVLRIRSQELGLGRPGAGHVWGEYRAKNSSCHPDCSASVAGCWDEGLTTRLEDCAKPIPRPRADTKNTCVHVYKRPSRGTVYFKRLFVFCSY